MTISDDVRNKLSIIIRIALEQLCCQRTHMFGEHIFLQSLKWFINHVICIVCWLQAALWQPNMNEIYSNLPFSMNDFLHLQSLKWFINHVICIVCWLQAALWQPNMNEIYSNLPFSRNDFLHLKCRDYFIIGQNMSSFHLWKYLFFKPPCSMNKIKEVYNSELDMQWCNDCL